MRRDHITVSLAALLLFASLLYGVDFDVDRSIDLQRDNICTVTDPTTNGQMTHTGNASFSGDVQIDGDITDTLQNDTTNNNTFVGTDGFSGTFYNDNNVAVGQFALDNPNTDNGVAYYGDGNVAIGMYSLTNNTTGYYNVGVGYETLKSNTSGLYNCALGYRTLRSNTTGNSNTGFGYSTLYLL